MRLSESIKQFSIRQHSDYIITLFFFIPGVLFTIYVFLIGNTPETFIKGLMMEPLLFTAYYLWAKSLIVDVVRIRQKYQDKSFGPGFVYWFYGLEWVTYWMINDIAYKSSRGHSLTGRPNSYMLDLYLSGSSAYWIVADVVTSLLLIPFIRLVPRDRGIYTYIVIDAIKSYLLLHVGTLMFGL